MPEGGVGEREVFEVAIGVGGRVLLRFGVLWFSRMPARLGNTRCNVFAGRPTLVVRLSGLEAAVWSSLKAPEAKGSGDCLFLSPVGCGDSGNRGKS